MRRITKKIVFLIALLRGTILRDLVEAWNKYNEGLFHHRPMCDTAQNARIGRRRDEVPPCTCGLAALKTIMAQFQPALDPVCATCGGSGRKVKASPYMADSVVPCPDCAEAAP